MDLNSAMFFSGVILLALPMFWPRVWGKFANASIALVIVLFLAGLFLVFVSLLREGQTEAPSNVTFSETLYRVSFKEAVTCSQPKVLGESGIAMVEFLEGDHLRTAFLANGKGIAKGDTVELVKVMARQRNGMGAQVWESVYVITRKAGYE